MNNENDIKELKRVIGICNKVVDHNLIDYKFSEVRESVVIIMDDKENSYYEIVIIENNKAYFFGDAYEVGNVVELKQYIAVLKENWVGGYTE